MTKNDKGKQINFSLKIVLDLTKNDEGERKSSEYVLDPQFVVNIFKHICNFRIKNHNHKSNNSLSYFIC